MSKYIDADALIMHLSDYALTESPNDTDSMKDRLIHETAYNAINECIKTVEEMPAADVEPVRHGKWQPRKSMAKSGRYEIEYVCSNCQRYFLHFSEWRDTHHYCPNCGAKMDGGSEE